MTPPPEPAWAIKAPDGKLNPNAERTRTMAIYSFCEFESEEATRQCWKEEYRKGYRCVRVEGRESEEG